jgi:hypothetical protein
MTVPLLSECPLRVGSRHPHAARKSNYVIAEGDKHDWLTRIYLHHYAFLRRIYPRQSAKAIYHFATLGISGLVSLALLALTAVALVAVSLVPGRPVVPWALPDEILFASCAAIVFLTGWAIDTRFRNLSDVDGETLELYGSDR